MSKKLSIHKTSRLANQIGICFFLSFGFVFLVAGTTSRVGLILDNYSDFLVAVFLVALSVFISLLFVQLVVTRPLELIVRNFTGDDKSSKSLPRYAARELIELEDAISQKINVNRALEEAKSRVNISQVQMSGIIDSALDAVVLINSDGKVTEWSKQAESLFGWSREEAIGEEMSEMIVPAHMRDMHHAGMDKYFETKQGPVINNRVEVPAVNRASEEFPVELTVTPFEIEGDTYFSAFVRDLREKKKAENDLATEKERLSVTLNSMREGVIVTDKEGNVTLTNPAATRLLILESEESCLGKPFVESVNDSDFIKKWQSASSSEEQLQNVDFIQSQDQVLSASTSVLSLDEENVFGLVTILRDVTEEREVDRMKSDFVSSVSHELRTPLTSIKGFTATMLSKPDLDSSTQKEFLGIIQEETDRLESLIRDLLEISVLETGKVSLRLTEFDLIEMLNKVGSIAKPLGDRCGVDFSISDCSSVTIKADQDKLQTAILNLSTNAIKFTPKGGSVRIDVDLGNKDRLVFKVVDTGMGIPKRDLDNIFNRFFRVNRPGTEIQGTGLGLTIVKEIVELHGGEISVESEVAKGTAFIIDLPRFSSV